MEVWVGGGEQIDIWGHGVLRARQGPRLRPLWTCSSPTCTPAPLCGTNAISLLHACVRAGARVHADS